LTLTNNVRIFARSWNPNHRNLTGANNPPISSPWSGVSAGTYVVKTPGLVVTELMYHPASPPTGSPYGEDDFQYLELMNTETGSLNIGGFQFINGIQWTFATPTTLTAGERVMMVKNQAAFESRYGTTVARIVGVF